MTIDKGKVTHAARNGIPLVIKTHTLPPQTEADLEEILLIYLSELGQSALKDHLSYCLKELTVNAKKANTKRIYFKEKVLDLNDQAQYEKGLKNFKTDTLDNIDYYLRLQEKEDLYVKVTYLIKDNTLYLTVRNNVQILQRELTRVYDRIARSRAFENMEDAFSEVLDDTEGAGLGIVIMILMLRKMGLTEKAFDLSLAQGETVATLTIPMNKVKHERVTLIADEIIKVIDSLPPFPDNLQKLLFLLSDPDVSFEKLANQLSLDPAMTADLIKYVNSAKYGVRKKIESIPDAIRIVGIQGLKDLIYPYGAHKLLERYLAKQRSLWIDATKVSFFAAELSRVLEFSREDQSQAQIGGILYNMGQIILSFIHPELSDRILHFCKAKGIPLELFEDLTASINPSDIGARIAEKWNFPDDLVQIIRYQNQPQLAIPEIQPLICIVNLAGSLHAVDSDLVGYNQLNQTVLKALGLTDLNRLQEIHGQIRKNYEKVKQNN